MPERRTTNDDRTISDLRDAPPGTLGRVGRRVGVGVLVVIVAAAGLDLLGPRTGTTSVEGGGYELDLEFPQIARAGEPAPLTLTIASDRGFGGPVRLRLCGEYFDHLDFQSWYPNPSAETSSRTPAASWLVYDFDPPPTDSVLRVALDARVAPGQLAGRDACEVSILAGDQPVVTATWTTWRMP